MRRAQMSTEPLFKILIFIFVLMLLLMFAVGLSKILASLLGFRFAPPPSASSAALALRCAINSVAYGGVNDYTCVSDVKIPAEVMYSPIKTYGEAVEYIEGMSELKQTLFSKLFHQAVMFFTNGKSGDYVGYAFGYVDERTGRQNITTVVCGNKDMLSGESDEVKNYFKYLADSDEFKCMVFDFSLPQYNKPIGVGSAIVPNFGDPDFVIYYEKLPEGEERAWLDQTDSWGTTGILIAGAVAAIPYAGTVLKTAIKEGASAAFKIVKSSMLFWKSAAREGAVAGVRDALMFEAKSYGAVIAREDAEAVAKKIMKGEFDDAVDRLVARGMSREAAEDLVYDWSWIKGLSKREIDVAFKFERQFVDYLIDPKKGKYFGLESDTFSNFMREWKKLPSETPEQMANKAKLFGKLVKGERVVINGKKFQLTKSEIDQIKKFVDERNKKLIGTYYKYYKRIPYKFRNAYYNKKVNELVLDYLKNARSYRLMMIEGLGYAGVFDQYSMGKVDVDGDGIKDDVFLENVLKCATVIPNTGIKSAIVGKGTCIILSAMGWASIWIDSKTYYKPVGVNSLGLYYPIVWFLYGKSVEYPLIEEAMPYYIYLDRMFAPTRLYLASPCKAVLYVERTKVDCVVPECDALKRYRDEYLANGELFPYETDYFLCKAPDGSCDVPKDYKAAGDQGYCYCINEPVNPCYDAVKCEKWIEEYLGCHKLEDGVYTPFALYTVSSNGVTSKFLVGGVDYHKVKELKSDVAGYKVCVPPAWYDVEIPWLGRRLFSTTYEVNAIKVTPALYDVKPNYCYWGKGDVSYAIEKVSLAALFLGIDLLVGETPLIIVSSMAYAYLDEKIDEKYRWWNHPDSLIPDWLAGFIPPIALLKVVGM